MKPTKLILSIAVMLAALSSCVTSKEVNYLADLSPDKNIPLNANFEAIIGPYDQLSITVIGVGTEKELAEPFNPYGGQVTEGQSGGYLVDARGNIQFPTLGELHVQGMTRLQLQETIKKWLIADGYMRNPMVDVRFENFRVFILGTDEGGKVLNITNESCTFLEALAMAGGLNKFTKRDHIAVMREVNGEMVTHFLDPRSSEVFNDPFFVLQQNDIIITQSLGRSYANEMVASTLGIVSSIASLVTSVAMVYLIFTGQQ